MVQRIQQQNIVMKKRIIIEMAHSMIQKKKKTCQKIIGPRLLIKSSIF